MGHNLPTITHYQAELQTHSYLALGISALPSVTGGADHRVWAGSQLLHVTAEASVGPPAWCYLRSSIFLNSTLTRKPRSQRCNVVMILVGHLSCISSSLARMPARKNTSGKDTVI